MWYRPIARRVKRSNPARHPDFGAINEGSDRDSAASTPRERESNAHALQKCAEGGPPTALSLKGWAARAGSATTTACRVGQTQLAPYKTDYYFCFHHAEGAAILRAWGRYA